MKISLIITTYNRPDALRAVLNSVNGQTIYPNEIIVADDGSNELTRLVIENFTKNSAIPIIHSWQEDCGFRVSASRNKAIAKANGDYILLIDGDMLLEKHYVQDYISAIRERCMYISSRVFLNEETTKRVENTENLFPITSLVNKDIEKNYCNSFRILLLYKILPHIKSYTKAKGYMGFWRKDCILVNGFDENFEGWGREDSDFMIRMINSGVIARKLKYSAISYHMWHKEASRSKELNNHKILEQTILKKSCRCDNGMDKYM